MRSLEAANAMEPADKLEILSEHLVEAYPVIALEVLGQASKFAIPLGWHYLLDLVWILKELDMPQGSTILDAGAGNGLIQYMLAGKGYRVISADMRERAVPAFASRLFHVRQIESSRVFNHSYREHLRVASHNSRLKAVLRSIVEGSVGHFFRIVLGGLRFCSDVIHGSSRNSATIYGEGSGEPVSERSGEIVYYSCDIRSMEELADNSVDAVVSVSALEHNPPEETSKCMSELRRILRPGGAMYLTVSASHPQSAFHGPSHSWLLNEADLASTYGLRDPYASNFEHFETLFSELRDSKYLKKWLSLYYLESGKSGMPWGTWDPAYQPVGIRLFKSC